MDTPAAFPRTVEDLKGAPWNPRAISDAAHAGLRVSMSEFGDIAGIVWNERTGHLVAGHQRVAGLKKNHDGGLKLEDGAIVTPDGARFPVRIVDWDEDRERAANVAANNPQIAGAFTDDIGPILERIREADAVLFESLRLDELEDSLPRLPVDVDEDDVPALDEEGEPDSKLGEIYELGPHRVMVGDCRAGSAVASLLQGERVNVAFTSPPYASQRKYDESSGFKPIPAEQYVDWFEDVQANVRAVLADDGSWFVNIKAHCEDGQRVLYVMDLVLSHVRRWGWRFVDELCWTHRGLPGTWPNRFKNAWEPVYHFTVGAPKFHPLAVGHESASMFHEGGRVSGTNRTGNQGWHGGDVQRTDGTARPGNHLDIPNNPANHGEQHEAAFPVALPEFFVKAYSDEGDVILDPFLGSGTTLIAAAQTGRVCVGMDISPRYVDVIRRRWTRYAEAHGVDPGSGALGD